MCPDAFHLRFLNAPMTFPEATPSQILEWRTHSLLRWFTKTDQSHPVATFCAWKSVSAGLWQGAASGGWRMCHGCHMTTSGPGSDTPQVLVSTSSFLRGSLLMAGGEDMVSGHAYPFSRPSKCAWRNANYCVFQPSLPLGFWAQTRPFQLDGLV